MIQIQKEWAKPEAMQSIIQITIVKDQKVMLKLNVKESTTIEQLREVAGLDNWLKFEVNNSIVPEVAESRPVTEFLDRQNTLFLFDYVGFYLYPKNKKFSEGLFRNGYGSLVQTRKEFRVPRTLFFILNDQYIPQEDEQRYQVTQLRRNKDIFLVNENMIQDLKLKAAFIKNPPELSRMRDVDEAPKGKKQQYVPKANQNETPTLQPQNGTVVTVFYRKAEYQKFIIDPKSMSLLALREQTIGGQNKRFLFYQHVLLDQDEQQPVSNYLDTHNYLYIYDFTNLTINPENTVFKSGCLNSGTDIQVSDLRRQHSIPDEYLFLYRGNFIRKENEKIFLIRHIRDDQDIYLLKESDSPNHQEAKYPEPQNELRVQIVLDDQLLQVNMFHKDILVQDVRHFIESQLPYYFINKNGKPLTFHEERIIKLNTLIVDEKALFIKSAKQPQPVKIQLQQNDKEWRINQKNYNPFTSLFELRKQWKIDRYRKFLFHQRILFAGDEKRPVHEFLDERGLLQCYDFIDFYVQPEVLPLKNRLLWVGPGESLKALREFNFISEDYVFILNKSYVPQEVEDQIKVKQLRIRQEVQLVKIENIMNLGLSRLLPHQFKEVSTLPDCYQPQQQQQQKKKQ